MRSKPASAKPELETAPESRFGAFTRSRWAYVVSSLMLLVPVFWQPRVQAGDLSSHIYNAWLAHLIERGSVQGLVIVRQTTNILFDLILSLLYGVVGAEAAQRIAVSLAVLTFVWGAFAFVSAVSGRKPWHLLCCIAILAYGWVFHMGFFNFYLSLGLCFWGLSIAWDWTLKRLVKAALLFVVAFVAHALPVAWAVCLLAYMILASRITPRLRVYVIAGSLAAMVIAHAVVSRTLAMRWSLQQITLTTGADQAWVFDTKYYLVLVGMVLVWGFLFLDVIHLRGARQVLTGIPFQLCVISAAGVFILPTTVLIPGFHHALVYIAERMSLGVGICVCALLGAARPKKFENYALSIVTVLFFVFLYRDERALNSFEDRMQDTVARLLPGQRVISAVDQPDLRVNALTHMIDRVCIEHCYSYANYEASTAQFRIRAEGPNPVVADTYEKSWLLQTGQYVVTDADVPLYQVDLDRRGLMVLKSLRAGVPCGSTLWKVI